MESLIIWFFITTFQEEYIRTFKLKWNIWAFNCMELLRSAMNDNTIGLTLIARLT